MKDAPQVRTSRVMPLSVRIIANLEIFVKTPIVLLGAFLVTWHRLPGLFGEFLIPSPFAAPFFTLLATGSFILALGILRKKQWGLDGLVAYCVLGLVNAPVVLMSQAHLAYETIQAQRMVMDSRITMEMAMKIQQIIITSVYAIGFTISAVVLYFLLTRRRAFRAACATRGEAFM